MIDTIFDLCVAILVWLGHTTGLTYKEVNVWIFVVVWPLFTLALIGMVVRQHIQLRKRTDA